MTKKKTHSNKSGSDKYGKLVYFGFVSDFLFWKIQASNLQLLFHLQNMFYREGISPMVYVMHARIGKVVAGNRQTTKNIIDDLGA